jgi:nucleoside-diphosphate-sugar epimerase
MAINFGRKFFERVLIFRPHNVYGPDMGFEHVIPEFAVRLQSLANAHRDKIGDLAQRIGHLAGRKIQLVPGPPNPGGTPRRCPDISKLAQLGYRPRVPLDEGLKPTLDWYWSRNTSDRASNRNFAQG